MIRINKTDEGWCLERSDWRSGQKELVYYSSLKEIARVITTEDREGNSIRTALQGDSVGDSRRPA